VKRLVEKVVIYCVRDGHLLVFRHLDYPPHEVGLQVPAGSIREGSIPIRFRHVESDVVQTTLLRMPSTKQGGRLQIGIGGGGEDGTQTERRSCLQRVMLIARKSDWTSRLSQGNV
jgi:hypothetical protein